MIEKDKDKRGDADKPPPLEPHAISENQAASPNAQTKPPQISSPEKSGRHAPCRLFMWGKCTKGVNCRFRHDYEIDELKKVIKFCHNFQNKGCVGKCTYLHATTDEVDLFKATGQLPRVLIERHAAAAAATAAAGNAAPEANFANRPPPPVHGSVPSVPPPVMIHPNLPAPHIQPGHVPPAFPRPQAPISGQIPIYQPVNLPPPAQTPRMQNPPMIPNTPMQNPQIMQNGPMVRNQVPSPMMPHQNHIMAGSIQPVNNIHQQDQFPMQQFPPRGPIMQQQQQQPPPHQHQCSPVQFPPPGAPFPPINMTQPPPPLPPTFTPNHPPPTVSLPAGNLTPAQNNMPDSKPNLEQNLTRADTAQHELARPGLDIEEVGARRSQSASVQQDSSLICDYCSDATTRIKEVNKYIESLSQKETEEAFALETLMDIHNHFKDALFVKLGPELSWRIKHMISNAEYSPGQSMQISTQDAQPMLVQLFQAFIQSQIQQPEQSLSSLLSNHLTEHQSVNSNQSLLAMLGLGGPPRRSGTPPASRGNVQEEVSKLLEEHTSELNQIQAGLSTTARTNSSLSNSNLTNSNSNHSSNGGGFTDPGAVNMKLPNGIKISGHGHTPRLAQAGMNHTGSPDLSRTNHAGVNVPSPEAIRMNGTHNNIPRISNGVMSAPPPAFNMNTTNSTIANNVPSGNVQPYYQMANQPPPRIFLPPEAQNPMQMYPMPQNFQNPVGPPPGFPSPGFPAPALQQGFYPAFQQGFQQMPPSSPRNCFQPPPGFQTSGTGNVGPPNNANYQG